MQNSNETKEPTFIADCHLGKLAKYLRLMGLDTLYFPQIDDDVLLDLATAEKRVILTRDRALYERKKADCLYLHSVRTDEQLREIIKRYALQEHQKSFSRCIVCNTPLSPIDKGEITQKLPPKVLKYFSHFEICKTCERIYWHGDHYKRMKAFLEEVLKSI
jgi:uncharacterized protein with PIN domain